jgi:hypothetical protein
MWVDPSPSSSEEVHGMHLKRHLFGRSSQQTSGWREILWTDCHQRGLIRKSHFCIYNKKMCAWLWISFPDLSNTNLLGAILWNHSPVFFHNWRWNQSPGVRTNRNDQESVRWKSKAKLHSHSKRLKWTCEWFRFVVTIRSNGTSFFFFFFFYLSRSSSDDSNSYDSTSEFAFLASPWKFLSTWLSFVQNLAKWCRRVNTTAGQKSGSLRNLLSLCQSVFSNELTPALE